jgi:HD-GYP domain-containing protein (c-di-GMP phosphodiesterase class II)
MDFQQGGGSFFHEDGLSSLNEDIGLPEKLRAVFEFVRERIPQVARIAIALYDADTDTLKTFAHASEGDNPLPLYEAHLSNSISLREIVERRQARIVNDTELYGTAAPHASNIRAVFGSSYTLPIFRNGEFVGFLFFNAVEKHAFDASSLHFFDLLGHLLALLVLDTLATPRAMLATVRAATVLSHHRDFETGTHVDRVAHYARLIAREIAPKYGLSDTDVEHIFLFAPLHDIGKIAIPDDILLKKGKLTTEEFEVMKTHTLKGHEIIDHMLADFRLDGTEHASVLRNIALFHHEAMNGSGYPYGQKGDEIPIEARITGVADVFDALTSKRPYKEAWSIDDAFQYLIELADSRFDRDCVGALVKNRRAVEEIQAQFAEDNLG